MFACVDNEGRVLAMNAGDMTGNSGWQQVNTTLTPADRLTDDHGAALYKVVNGTTQERTQQEREADWPPDPEPVPTLNERMTAAEERLEFHEECLMEMSEEVYK